jgi:hypothetical protein
MKNEGVPVLENVAEIFLPISPDLPRPTTTTRPEQAKKMSKEFSIWTSSRARNLPSSAISDSRAKQAALSARMWVGAVTCIPEN